MPLRPWHSRAALALLLLSALLPFQNCGAPGSSTDYVKSSSSGGGPTGNQSYPPDPATSLILHIASNQQIDLRWQDNSDNEAGFRIQRAKEASGQVIGGVGTYATIATTGPNVTAYTDSNLQAATTYYYRIVPYNNAGNGDTSQASFGTTFNNPTAAPNAPSNLVALPSAATVVNLAWNDNSSNESSFKLERSVNAGATFTLIASISADQTSYADTNLSPSTAYSYRIRATNSLGDSANSGTVSATTQPAVNTSTFTFNDANVLQTNCVSCHRAGQAAAGVNLDGYAAAKGNASQLYSAIANNRMPPGNPLTSLQKGWVKSWIDSGAPNN